MITGSKKRARADRADLRRVACGRRAGGDQRMGGNVTSSASDDELHQRELTVRLFSSEAAAVPL